MNKVILMGRLTREPDVRYSQNADGSMAGKRNKDNLDLEPYAITNEHGFIRQSEAHDEFGYMKDTDRKAYNIVQPNSFAYNPARINVGSIGYYEGSENVIVSSLYEVFQTDKYVNDRFLWHWLKSDQLPRWIEKLQEGSVRLYFYYDKLCECQLHLPSLEEQEKIAAYIDSLDHLIALHQRKGDETKKLKKFMLQKMFPKKDAKKPEIRFAGFTDDWEQRKLGESVSITSGEAPSKFEVGTELYVKVDDLNYNDKYVVDTQNKVAEHSTVKRVTKGSVVFPKRGAAIMTNKVRIMGIDGYMDTNMMALTSEKLDSEFLYNIISKEGLYKIADTSTIPQINNKHVEPYEVTIPSLDEQRKIGAYFKQLDHLITLHQRKCDELKEFKKYMLQNMFPQKG